MKGYQVMRSKKSPKNDLPIIAAGKDEFHGAVIDRHGNVYSEVALRTLLSAVIYGKAVITHYPTKTAYSFIIGKKRGWSNKISDKIYSEDVS